MRGVSNHEGTQVERLPPILRDASLRDAPLDEVVQASGFAARA
jgi:hypothetical protein